MHRFARWLIVSVLVAIIALTLPSIIKVARLLSTPLECGKQIDKEAVNARGDVVAEELKICFGLGAFIDYSITLRVNGVTPQSVLAEFIPHRATSVVFRWINDDNLLIDLGEVRPVSSQVHKVGSIHITYIYTKS